MNEVWNMVENLFVAFNITYIPRYRPFVPNNIKQWRIFEDDFEIKRFLELTGDFSNSIIDQEQDDEIEYFEGVQKMRLQITRSLS